MLYSGVGEKICKFRENRWIPEGSESVQIVVNKCLLCQKYAVVPSKQITAQLPRDQIAETPVFRLCSRLHLTCFI